MPQGFVQCTKLMVTDECEIREGEAAPHKCASGWLLEVSAAHTAAKTASCSPPCSDLPEPVPLREHRHCSYSMQTKISPAGLSSAQQRQLEGVFSPMAVPGGCAGPGLWAGAVGAAAPGTGGHGTATPGALGNSSTSHRPSRSRARPRPGKAPHLPPGPRRSRSGPGQRPAGQHSPSSRVAFMQSKSTPPTTDPPRKPKDRPTKM